MGRINLTALRVRTQALANVETRKTKTRPIWVDIAADVPPAQVMTRQQPIRHELTRTRTKQLPNGKLVQTTEVTIAKKPRSYRPSKMFMPMPVRYEEDALRARFFADHPWELARPRVVLETDGDQHRDADWSTGLLQPGIPLSGESVVQRQLYFLHAIPNITVAEAYDKARREFYVLRRQEDLRRRIAAEEAEATGAIFSPNALVWGMQNESKMYDDWEAWSRKQMVEQQQRSASFAGEAAPSEEEAIEEVVEAEREGAKIDGASKDGQIGKNAGNDEAPTRPRIGSRVFAGEAARQRLKRPS